HKIGNTLTNGGIYALTGGSLEVKDLILHYASQDEIGSLSISNASIVNSGKFIDHGTLQVNNASPQLGELYVSSPPSGPLFGSDTARIIFGAGTNIVHFAGCAASWGSNALLRIIGWKGFVTGGGTNQLFVGNNSSSVSAVQLGQIQFDAPYFATATILSSGEIVPGNPLLSYETTAGRLVLSWQGNSVLPAATNVLGPFTDVSGAVSPYTNVSVQIPQRYFRLRATW